MQVDLHPTCQEIFSLVELHRMQALHLPRKMYAFLVPPCRNTFLKTTEHSWIKTILSRGSRGKCLANKLIRIERVSGYHRTASTAPYTHGMTTSSTSKTGSSIKGKSKLTKRQLKNSKQYIMFIVVMHLALQALSSASSQACHW